MTETDELRAEVERLELVLDVAQERLRHALLGADSGVAAMDEATQGKAEVELCH